MSKVVGRVRQALAAAAVMVLAVLAGCAPAVGPDPEPAEPAPPEASDSGFPSFPPEPLPTTFGPGQEEEEEPGEYDGPAAPPLRTQEIWESADEDLRAGVIALLEDGVVLSDEERAVFRIGADGRQRWAVREPVRLSGKITDADLNYGFATSLDGGTNRIVVAAYQWDPCKVDMNGCARQGKEPTPEVGIAALSVQDGQPVWTRVLEPHRMVVPGGNDPGDPGKRYLPQVVSEAAVLVEVKPDDPDSDLPAERTTTVALDPATGKDLWSRPKFVVDWASGDRVLGRDVRPGSGGLLDLDGYPVLLDARTGDEIWRGTDIGAWKVGAGQGLLQDAYGYGVVEPDIDDDSGKAGRLVDLATGAAQPIEAIGPVVGRDAAGPFLAWWSVGDAGLRLLSRDLPDGRAEAAKPDEQSLTLVGSGGYLWSSGDVAAYDRGGALRLERIPGALLAVNERWLVIKPQSLQVRVYRLST